MAQVVQAEEVTRSGQRTFLLSPKCGPFYCRLTVFGEDPCNCTVGGLTSSVGVRADAQEGARPEKIDLISVRQVNDAHPPKNSIPMWHTTFYPPVREIRAVVRTGRTALLVLVASLAEPAIAAEQAPPSTKPTGDFAESIRPIFVRLYGLLVQAVQLRGQVRRLPWLPSSP